MNARDRREVDVVVAVGASAGGVEALRAFVSSLPSDLPAAVLVVLHLSETGPSVLPGILQRAGALPARHAVDGDRLLPSTIFVAPPGLHLRVTDGHLVLDRGPRENGHRPSADALFVSVADAFGDRAAGVILSGTMDDGAAGLKAIKLQGGYTMVQDPEQATFPGMPRAAIGEVLPDLVCKVEEMGGALAAWALALEPRYPKSNADPVAGGAHVVVTEFTCPDCGGTLYLDDSRGVVRYRCRVGHAYSVDALLNGKHDAVEAALWAAVVALEERADLLGRVLARIGRSSRPEQRHRYVEEIEHSKHSMGVLQRLIAELVGRGAMDESGGRDDADD